MSFDAEATIAEELMKFAMDGQLYRGSKPVMWSVVERTALAEAEVEYQDYESDTVWVKFGAASQLGESGRRIHDEKLDGEPGAYSDPFVGAFVVIWTTTPWTMPGNRAVSYSPRIAYGLYEVTAAENDFGPQPGEKFIVADALLGRSRRRPRSKPRSCAAVDGDELAALTLQPPASWLGRGLHLRCAAHRRRSRHR
jgi:isoleucyl-tRNA synthetase